MKSTGLFDLTGKVALVTGARTGLGQAMALALADAGADIIGLGSSAMPDTRKRIEALGRRFEEIICDLSFGSNFDTVVAHAGRIDILVNNAGIIRRSDFLDMAETDWDEVLTVLIPSSRLSSG
jgi:2-dehydro-3-deoxy-D-gluconate 5-dehydrogenase